MKDLEELRVLDKLYHNVVCQALESLQKYKTASTETDLGKVTTYSNLNNSVIISENGNTYQITYKISQSINKEEEYLYLTGECLYEILTFLN